MIDQATEERTAELLERRRHGTLTASERAELDAALAADPLLRSLADELDIGDAAMQATIRAAVEHFDFEKSLHAAESQRRLARKYLRFYCAICGLGLAVAAGSAAFGTTGWGLVYFMALAWSIPLALILLAAHQRRTNAARIASGDPAAARAAFDAHLRQGRHERTIVQALGIVGGLGVVVVLIDAVLQGAHARAALFAFLLVMIVHAVWNRYGSPRARRRHERLLTGDLDDTAWLTGKDPAA